MVETERLIMREMTQADFADLCKILQDKDVMYAYEGPYNDAEVQEWLDRQINRYKNEKGRGLYAVILKETGEMIGQSGLTYQPFKDRRVLEVGYLLNKNYWHKGYAIEGARFWKEYAFNELGAQEVFSIIRDNNIPSQNVAIRNGMKIVDTFIKHYRGVDVPHYLFGVKK